MDCLSIDRELFFFFNDSIHFALGDIVIPFFREKYFWVPLYVYLLFFLVFNYSYRSILIIFAVLLIVAMADGLTSGLIKPLVARIRPCNDPALMQQVNLLCACGGWSFPSSHAANHFGIATFFSHFFVNKNWVRFLFILWAMLICVAQLYVGLHYPSDIIVGALLGIIIASIVYLIYLQVAMKLKQM